MDPVTGMEAVKVPEVVRRVSEEAPQVAAAEVDEAEWRSKAATQVHKPAVLVKVVVAVIEADPVAVIEADPVAAALEAVEEEVAVEVISLRPSSQVEKFSSRWAPA